MNVDVWLVHSAGRDQNSSSEPGVGPPAGGDAAGPGGDPAGPGDEA